MSALKDFLAANRLPEGMELLDLAALEEEAQHAAVAADDAAQAVSRFVRQIMANVTAGGVTFTPDDVTKLITMLDLVAGRTAEAVEACDTVLTARSEDVQ